MDRHVTRALEMGLGLILFAMGLSVFFTMNNSTIAYTRQGEDSAENHVQFQVAQGTEADESYTAEAIYMLLTDDSMQPEANVLGGISYGSSRVEVYIDGTHFPAVSDYQDRQSLKTALSALTATQFDVSYVTDSSERISEIHFTGR